MRASRSWMSWNAADRAAELHAVLGVLAPPPRRRRSYPDRAPGHAAPGAAQHGWCRRTSWRSAAGWPPAPGTPSRVRSAFCVMRSASLFSILVAANPGMSFSTTKPLTSSSSVTSLAQTTIEVGEGAVADPALRAVEHPLVALAARGGLQAAGDVGTAVRLGQAERADLAPGGAWPAASARAARRSRMRGCCPSPGRCGRRRRTRTTRRRARARGDETGEQAAPGRAVGQVERQAHDVQLGQLRAAARAGTPRAPSSRRRSAPEVLVSQARRSASRPSLAVVEQER